MSHYVKKNMSKPVLHVILYQNYDHGIKKPCEGAVIQAKIPYKSCLPDLIKYKGKFYRKFKDPERSFLDCIYIHVPFTKAKSSKPYFTII
jgi:hypothetical protein